MSSNIKSPAESKEPDNQSAELDSSTVDDEGSRSVNEIARQFPHAVSIGTVEEQRISVKEEEQQIKEEQNSETDDESAPSQETAALPVNTQDGFTTPPRSPRRANMNALFSTGRGKDMARPRNSENYNNCSRTALEKRRIVKGGCYVIANWGISSAAHKVVQKPSLRDLAVKSWNSDDMSAQLIQNCRRVETDKGGSVVRFYFTSEAEDHEIVEFASSLHGRLVTEFLYKATPEQNDEIVVYYACKTDHGFFEYLV